MIRLANSYLQEAVSAAQKVRLFHDAVSSEDELILTEGRLIWASVDRLERTKNQKQSFAQSVVTGRETVTLQMHAPSFTALH